MNESFSREKKQEKEKESFEVNGSPETGFTIAPSTDTEEEISKNESLFSTEKAAEEFIEKAKKVAPEEQEGM